MNKLKICFVHSPVVSSNSFTPSIGHLRGDFKESFDKRYFGIYPERLPVDSSIPIDNSIWELPHWMNWLGGVLDHLGYEELEYFFPAVEFPVIGEVGVDETIRDYGVLDDIPFADVYLFSPMVSNLHLSLELCDIVKEKVPDSISVFGGCASTPLKENIIKNEQVDFIIFGKGEEALPILLERINEETKGKTMPKKPNEIYVNDLGNVCTENFCSDFEYSGIHPKDLPFPAIDIIHPAIGAKMRYIRVCHGVGCIPGRGGRKEYFPIERVIDEVLAYQEYYGDHQTIYFGDEAFVTNRKETMKLLEVLKDHDSIRFDIQSRLNQLEDEELLDSLKEAGCRWVEVGVESLSNTESLKTHKGLNYDFDDVLRVFEKLREAELATCSFIMNGLPDQTADEMLETVDIVGELIEDGLLHASHYFGLTPYPGSQMYNNPEQFGMKLLHHDYRFYNENYIPVYDTIHNSAMEIFEVYCEGLIRLAKVMGNKKPKMGKDLVTECEYVFGKSLYNTY